MMRAAGAMFMLCRDPMSHALSHSPADVKKCATRLLAGNDSPAEHRGCIRRNVLNLEPVQPHTMEVFIKVLL